MGKYKNLYPIYGLRDTSEITSSVLSDDVQGLYLFGNLSVGDGEKKKEEKQKQVASQSDGVTFQMLSVVGINNDFVPMKREYNKKLDSIVQNVTDKVVAIQCSHIKFVG